MQLNAPKVLAERVTQSLGVFVALSRDMTPTSFLSMQLLSKWFYKFGIARA